jgi:serine/threonine protein phosphatase 1
VTGRLFAIGDIHGCARELETLLRGLPLVPGDTVAFVGDYLDRGPDSRPVVDLLLELRAQVGLRSVFLRGNHEDMCLGFLGRRGHHGDVWIANGGAATLRSYGLDARLPEVEIAAAFPPAHLGFLDALGVSFAWEGYLLVHAGIHPGRAWSEQREDDLLWIREEFLHHRHGLSQTVVFGHTPHRGVLVDLPYKIGIDTGCVYGGALSALELPARVLHQVRFGDRSVRQALLPPTLRRQTARDDLVI